MKDFILFGQPEIGDNEINEVIDSLKITLPYLNDPKAVAPYQLFSKIFIVC